MLSFDAKKIIILAVFFVDCTLHGAVVFGWSSIDQIIKHENYFNDVAETTSQETCQFSLNLKKLDCSKVKLTRQLKNFLFILSFSFNQECDILNVKQL